LASLWGLGLETAALDRLLAEGCQALVRDHGLGLPEDLDFIESRGVLAGADPGAVSERAKERGRDQVGTLGGGNHFLEVQVVKEVYDPRAARAMGLFEGQVAVLIHSGSRGLGHQVCTDYVRLMDQSVARHGISLPDRQLACASFAGAAGQRYYGAMVAASNFARANRQVITHLVRRVFRRVLGRSDDALGLELVYDVCHNIAKVERYDQHTRGAGTRFLAGAGKQLCVCIFAG